jgi:hypothetical protein
MLYVLFFPLFNLEKVPEVKLKTPKKTKKLLAFYPKGSGFL